VSAFARIGACACLACASLVLAAAPTAAKPEAAGTPEIRVAHSALLAVDATPTDDSVALYIKRAADQAAASTSDVVVSVDGRVQTLSRGSDGSYLLSAADLRDNSPHTVEITASHDGIREILAGQLTLPPPRGGSFISEHRQIGWWVLNIAIVLIAAIALSRRRK